MLECETVARKWGNSLGVTLPKEIIEKGHIKENETIRVLILKKNNTLKKTFGVMKGKFKKSTQKIKDELRSELYND